MTKSSTSATTSSRCSPRSERRPVEAQRRPVPTTWRRGMPDSSRDGSCLRERWMPDSSRDGRCPVKGGCPIRHVTEGASVKGGCPIRHVTEAASVKGAYPNHHVTESGSLTGRDVPTRRLDQRTQPRSNIRNNKKPTGLETVTPSVGEVGVRHVTFRVVVVWGVGLCHVTFRVVLATDATCGYPVGQPRRSGGTSAVHQPAKRACLRAEESGPSGTW